MKDFGIVIPHLDYSESLATCLWSIVTQEGSASVHCHIQDGGTTSVAMEILDEIRNSLNRGRFLLTYANEADLNAADAINKGMAAINARMVTWLGADDFLMPGALQMVSSLRAQHPNIRWVTGLPHIVSEDGVGFPTFESAGFYRHASGFSREALKRGLFAGELNHGWIQQEGTFWEKSLWDQVGGLNQSLSLAFDFDLWCRMARHSELVEVVAPLGAFRRRSGQASSNQAGYFEEASQVKTRAWNLSPHMKRRFVNEVTWIAYYGKSDGKWNLVRGEFLIWFIRSSGPLLRSFFASAVKARLIRSLRKLAPSLFILRVVFFLWGALRRFFHRA